MQVHSDDMVTSSHLQHVGHEPRGDGRPALVLLVLARVGEVGDDGGDAPRGGRLAGVYHDQQLHEPVVDFARRGGLQDEDVLVADGLADCDRRFLVRVLQDHDLAEVDAETGVRWLALCSCGWRKGLGSVGLSALLVYA